MNIKELKKGVKIGAESFYNIEEVIYVGEGYIITHYKDILGNISTGLHSFEELEQKEAYIVEDGTQNNRKKWKPKKGELYFSISAENKNKITIQRKIYSPLKEKDHLISGNYFRTEKEARKYIKEVLQKDLALQEIPFNDF